jgi:hypothetical protein
LVDPAAAPKRQELTTEEQAGYRRLTDTILKEMNHELPHGGWVFVDGVAGIGKTTLADFIQHTDKIQQHRVHILDLDAFLLKSEIRIPLEERVAREKNIVTDIFKREFRIGDMEQFLTDVSDFMASPGDPLEERTFRVPDPYERVRDRSQFSVRRGDTIVSIGADPWDLPVVHQMKVPTVGFRFELNGNKKTVRSQFEKRSRRTYPNNEPLIQQRMDYYDIATAPSWSVYDKNTAPFVRYQIDVAGSPDRWTIRKNTPANGIFHHSWILGALPGDLSLSQVILTSVGLLAWWIATGHSSIPRRSRNLLYAA